MKRITHDFYDRAMMIHCKIGNIEIFFSYHTTHYDAMQQDNFIKKIFNHQREKKLVDEKERVMWKSQR